MKKLEKDNKKISEDNSKVLKLLDTVINDLGKKYRNLNTMERYDLFLRLKIVREFLKEGGIVE